MLVLAGPVLMFGRATQRLRQTGLTKFHYATGTGFWVLPAGGVVALITPGLALLPATDEPNT